MPKLSVIMVRTALICMGIGFLFGSLVLHHKGVPIYAWTWSLLPSHIELMIFGWTLQLAMGVGFWILPRFSPGEIARHGYRDRYGNTRRFWVVYVLFNVGILVSAWAGFAAEGAWQAAGRAVMLVAVLLYIALMWPRLRAFSDMIAPTNSRDEVQSDEPARSGNAGSIS